MLMNVWIGFSSVDLFSMLDHFVKYSHLLDRFGCVVLSCGLFGVHAYGNLERKGTTYFIFYLFFGIIQGLSLKRKN